MGKQSILRDRYGKMQFKMVNLDTVNECIPILSHYQRQKLNLSSTGSLILSAMVNFPKSNTNKYRSYSRIPLEYRNQLMLRSNPQSLSQLTHRTFIRKLLYFYLYPEQYNNNFEDFCIPWITESLFIMRKSIMKQMIRRNEIPLIYNYGSISHPLYNFPTSLSIPDTIRLSHHIHDLLYSSLLVYKSLYPSLFIKL